MLQRVFALEREGGSPRPFGDLLRDPRQSAGAYRILRELEDVFRAVTLEPGENQHDPYGNRWQYVALTDKGAGILADHHTGEEIATGGGGGSGAMRR